MPNHTLSKKMYLENTLSAVRQILKVAENVTVSIHKTLIKLKNERISRQTNPRRSCLKFWDWPVLLAFGRYPAGHAWQVVSSRRNSLTAHATQTQQHLCSCPPVWKFWNPKHQTLSKTWDSHVDDSEGNTHTLMKQLLPSYCPTKGSIPTN